MAGAIARSGYFGSYERLGAKVRMVLADVDGAALLVAECDEQGVWVARGIVRVEFRDGRIAEIADYKH